MTEQDTVRVLGGSLEVRSTPAPGWTVISGMDVYQDAVGSWRKDTDLTSGSVTDKRGLYPTARGLCPLRRLRKAR